MFYRQWFGVLTKLAKILSNLLGGRLLTDSTNENLLCLALPASRKKDANVSLYFYFYFYFYCCWTKDVHVSWFHSFTCSLESQAWGRWPFHPRGEKRPTTPFCFSSYFQFSSLILIDTRGNEEADRNVMKPNPRLRCNQSFVNEMIFGVIQI